ncbi:MAG: hypothetical protein EBQ92_00375, partial [Proteobacteria bacterium]|nr:hypothetical protein [Pseudomonadota bacterium]
MPIPLFGGQFYASKGAEDQIHRGLDTQFGGMYCGIDSGLISEAYALVQSDSVKGQSPNTWLPADTIVKGNKCYPGPLNTQWWYEHCMTPVLNAQELIKNCKKGDWDGGYWCVTYDEAGWPTYHPNMPYHVTLAEEGPAGCAKQRKESEEAELGYTCTTPNTSFTQNITIEYPIYDSNKRFLRYANRSITVHPCASVGQMKSLHDYKFPEKSSAVAERETNPKLDEAKADFLAPLISTIRSAYFLGGGIIGGWLVYLNAKSENLS